MHKNHRNSRFWLVAAAEISQIQKYDTKYTDRENPYNFYVILRKNKFFIIFTFPIYITVLENFM